MTTRAGDFSVLGAETVRSRTNPVARLAPTGTRWWSAWGPAWLVMIANVDAASILTAVASGVAFRYELVGVLLALTAPIYFVQEAAGRLGAVTGKGLGELARTTRFSAVIAVPMALCDVATYVAEYAAIALGLGLFGVPLVLSLPIAFILHIGLVARGKYAWAERILLGISAVFVLAVGMAMVMRGVLPDDPLYLSGSPAFLFLVAANAGAAVMPFMLFFQTSATALKGGASIAGVRLETLVGAVTCELLMVAFVMLGAGMPSGANLFTSSGMAAGLATVGGGLLPYVFGIGLVSAAFLALVVISLGSAWGIVEALGIAKSRLFWVYVLESIPAVVVPFVYPHPLVIVLTFMVALVFLLIGPGILLGWLTSRRDLMGEFTSSRWWRTAYWASLVSIVGCGVLALVP